MNELLRVLVRDHSNYTKWETRFGNALKIKKNGEEQKRPTPYIITEGYRNQVTVWLDQCGENLKTLEKQIVEELKTSPVWTEYFQAIPGIGPLTIAYLEAYVDLSKASTDNRVVVSKVWRYCGYGDPADKMIRGETRKYNASLKIQLFKGGLSLEKTRNTCGHKYGKIYDDEKTRLVNSEREVAETQTGGKKKLVAWKDAKPEHRREAAIRRMIKELIKDYVITKAELEGREVRQLYGVEYLGRKHGG